MHFDSCWATEGTSRVKLEVLGLKDILGDLKVRHTRAGGHQLERIERGVAEWD